MTTTVERDIRLSSVVPLSSVSEPEFVRRIREQAADRFHSLGLPTTKLEEWKYTSLAPLARVDFHLDGRTRGRRDTHGSSLCGRALAELVFVNGRFAPDMCSNSEHPSVRVMPIAEAMKRENFERHFSRYADYSEHSMTALNTALFSSDYPHSVTLWPHSREHATKLTAGLSPAAAAKILAGNAELGLEFLERGGTRHRARSASFATPRTTPTAWRATGKAGCSPASTSRGV